MKRTVLALAILAAWATQGSAAGPPRASAGSAAERSEGIAARYPGDAGIERDPRVLLHEDFESGTFDRERWTNIKGAPKRGADAKADEAAALSFSADVPEASRGRRSLLVTATLGRDTGGHLFRRFKPGVETMYARFYVRFAPDCDYIHHFVHIVAENPPHPWPTGGAGERPAGDRKFSTGLEPWGRWGRFPRPGAWHFYSYWWKMKRAPDGKFWGNDFSPPEPAVPRRGRWSSAEMMVRANTPGRADGRQAFWIDGRKVGDFGGIEWRKTADLKINAFWLMSYVTEHSAKTSRVNRVWFDDVVVATGYIGPIGGAARRGGSGSRAKPPPR